MFRVLGYHVSGRGWRCVWVCCTYYCIIMYLGTNNTTRTAPYSSRAVDLACSIRIWLAGEQHGFVVHVADVGSDWLGREDVDRMCALVDLSWMNA